MFESSMKTLFWSLKKPIPMQFQYKFNQILLRYFLYINAELHRCLCCHRDRRQSKWKVGYRISSHPCHV